jgi:hypothetical protein
MGTMPFKFQFTVANMLKAIGWFAICCVALSIAIRSFNREELEMGERVVRLILCSTIVAVAMTFSVATLFGLPKVGYALGYAIAFVIVPATVVVFVVAAMLLAWLI